MVIAMVIAKAADITVKSLTIGGILENLLLRTTFRLSQRIICWQSRQGANWVELVRGPELIDLELDFSCSSIGASALSTLFGRLPAPQYGNVYIELGLQHLLKTAVVKWLSLTLL